MDVSFKEIKESEKFAVEESAQRMGGDSLQSHGHESTTGKPAIASASNQHQGMLLGNKKSTVEDGLSKHTRTLSLDSQNFLSHVLSVDGDELYNLLSSEPGASSYSPGKNIHLPRKESDGTMLADMMHALMEDPHFQMQLDQRHGDQKDVDHGSIPLFSDKTLNAVLGEEFREIAADVTRGQEVRGNETRAPSLVALPPQEQHPPQQFLTLLDGTVLQRDNGSPVIATLPEGDVQLTVPLPGSSSVLQYVPVLDSTVVSEQPMLKPQVESQQPASRSEGSPFEQNSSMILSPSQTEEMIAAAARQHSELQEASRGSLPKPQLRPTDSADFEASELSNGQGSTRVLSRKISHKRERSLNTARLMSSESLRAPDMKLANSSGSLDGTTQYSAEFLEKTSPNSPLNSLITREKNNVSGGNAEAAEDFGLYIKPIKLFSDGLEIDDDIARIIEDTLATPPGMKRRGRPPGRSKHADNIPGFVEPTDAEILANLLLENRELKTMSADDLKKLVRKEKNKISAAISRYRIQQETKILEGKLKRLEQEKINLSQWLNTTPEIQPHRMLLADGQNVPSTGDGVPRPPIRHLSL